MVDRVYGPAITTTGEENTLLKSHPASDKYGAYISDRDDKTGEIYDESGNRCGIDAETRAERIEELDELIREKIDGDTEEG